MANEHVIDVKVRADTTGLSKGLDQSAKDLNKASEGFSKYGEGAGAAGKSTQSFVEKNRGHMESVGKDAMIMGGAILAGMGVAVHAYSEFAGRMAQVQSLSHASAAEMAVLTSSALTMGTAFGQSANDVADAQIELVKAGVSVKEMMGGALPGALALAAAGQINVGEATEIAVIALTQFKLRGQDIPHVADLLAAGADKALGGVQELGEGLKQGGLVASSFGLTVDDTVGTLAAFANAGLMGSDAGTSLKTMLLALANPSKEARNKMAELGIAAFDVNDKFVGVTSLAGQLKDKLGPLADAQQKQALATIFGTDAIRSANVLMEQGSEGIQQWITDVNDQGFAAAQAAGKLDSLNGDFKKLQATAETGLIQMGSTADGALRPLVQGLTDVIQGFNELDPVAQRSIMTWAGLAGGTLLVGGALLTTIPKIYDTVKAVQALNAASPNAASALASLGKVALPAAAALTAVLIVKKIAEDMLPAAKSTQEMTAALIDLAKGKKTVNEAFGKETFARANNGLFGLKGMTEQIDTAGSAIARLNDLSDSDRVNDFMNGFINLGGKLPELRKSLDGIDTAMSSLATSGSPDLAAQSFKKIADEASKQGVSVETTAKSFPQYMASLQKLSNDMKVPLNSQELLNWALGEVPQKMKDAAASTEGQAKAAEIAAQQTEDQAKALEELGLSADGAILNLDKFTTALINAGLLTLSSRDATAKFDEALDGLNGKVREIMATEQAHGGVLNETKTDLDLYSEAGRAANGVLADMTQKGLGAASAMAKNGDSQEAVQGQLNKTYDAMVLTARGFGLGKEEAEKLTGSILHIPPGVDVKTWMSEEAKRMAEQTKGAIDNIPKQVFIDIWQTTHDTTLKKTIEDPGGMGSGNGDGRANGSLRGGLAAGGPVYGPGPKGVDSEWYKLAPGEHVWTAAEVDAAGGQSAVKQLRSAALAGGVRPSYATPAPSAPAAMGGFGSVPFSLDGYTLSLNADATMATFHRIAYQASEAQLSSVSRQVGGMRR